MNIAQIREAVGNPVKPEREVVMLESELEDYAEWRRMRRRMYKTLHYGQTSGPPFVFRGEEFEAARHKLGLSRREVAEILDVSRNTVMYWEKGQAHPRGPVMRRKAVLFMAQAQEGA